MCRRRSRNDRVASGLDPRCGPGSRHRRRRPGRPNLRKMRGSRSDRTRPSTPQADGEGAGHTLEPAYAAISAARSYSAEWVTRASRSVPAEAVAPAHVGALEERQGTPDHRSRAPGPSWRPMSRYSDSSDGALDEHLDRPATQRAQLLLRDVALNAEELAPARVHLFRRHALRQERGHRAVLTREVEDAHPIERRLAHEVAQPLEGLLRLARMSDDEGRPQRHAGHVRARTRSHRSAHLLPRRSRGAWHLSTPLSMCWIGTSRYFGDARLARHDVEQLVRADRCDG